MAINVFLMLPAYNEEKNIEALLQSAMQLGLSIVLIDDGSTDATVKKAEALNLPNLVVVRHGENKGLGQAMQTGFSYIAEHADDNDVIVTMDADNTHPVHYIPELLKTLEKGYDCVIASRFVEHRKEKGLSVFRKLLSRGARIVIGALFGHEVADYTCGYRGYKVSLIRNLQKVFGRDKDFIREKGFACMAEILLKALYIKARVAEIPFVLRYDLKQGKSKIRIAATIFAYFRMFLRIKGFRMGMY